MKKITIEMIKSCIEAPIATPNAVESSDLVITCGELHHIYHRHLKTYIHDGSLLLDDVLRAFQLTLTSDEQPYQKSQFYAELASHLGIERCRLPP